MARPRTLAIQELGRTLVSMDQRVSLRQMLAYAAGIGATETIYFDDARPGGVVAAPGFNSVYEWPLLLDAAYLAAIGLPRDELFQHLLHAFQDTRYHRVVRAGSQLSSSLSIVAVRQIAAGCLVVAHIRTVDGSTGAPVSDTWFGSILRGHFCAEAGNATPPVPELPAQGADAQPQGQDFLDVPLSLAHV